MSDTTAQNKKNIVSRAMALWDYVNTGIWSDSRRTWWISIVKTISLSVRSFLNRDLQTQACAMTYRTLLAVVPALALLMAIGRGFGLQTVLKEELFRLFPAQHVAINYALNFVESYLQHTSEGLFVGVGIVFLIYTLISLVSNVEDTFNLVWGVKEGRSFWRKITDYTSMLLILPVLMICAGGLSLLISSTIETIFDFEFLTPLISWSIEFASWVMTWLFFTAVYILIPNTKVKFLNAFIAGVICGSGFLVLQWLFVTGTLYVTRYNAIYGSFAFLPLLLLWMQLTWVVCLAGAVICYSSQNIFSFSMEREVSTISVRYRSKIIMAISAVAVKRFVAGLRPLSAHELMDYYELPARLVTEITDRLCAAGVLSRVVIDDKKEIYGFQPALDPAVMTAGEVAARLEALGTRSFIPEFELNFPGVGPAMQKISDALADVASEVRLTDIDIRIRPENINS
ncbi:MAG: YihY/virulence factor BrkB family protein [Muribaculaceae bacterium]|jgi:membrane protein